jgi:segregation and condensation protein B
MESAVRKQEYYTYADYLTWDDKVRYELIDGMPYMMASPSQKHQEISGELFRQLGNFLLGKPCKPFHAPFDVRLNANKSDDTVVQPDLLVVCDHSKLDGKSVNGAPDFIIEILSPSTMSYDLIIKLNKYMRSGVREYWVVDPESRPRGRAFARRGLRCRGIRQGRHNHADRRRGLRSQFRGRVLKQEGIMELQSPNIGVIEAVLFACGEPISADKLAQICGLEKSALLHGLELLKQRCDSDDSGIMLLQLGGSYQLATKPEHAHCIRAAVEAKRNAPLSPAAMEALAIVAYNQPVSKAFVEQVRGIDSSGVVNTLNERGLLEEAGRLDLPGRPIAYRTTDNFLRCFGIRRLSELPPLDELGTSEQLSFQVTLDEGLTVDS